MPRFGHSLPALVMLAAAFILGVPFAAASQATPPPAASAPPTTAVVVAATNDPLLVAGSDGADHLEYDLVVANAFVAPVTLDAIEVLAPDGAILLRLDGDALVEATQPLLAQTPTAEIAPSAVAAVVMDVVVPTGEAPERLTHRIAYSVAPDAPARSLIGSFEVAGPDLAVDPRPATVIGPPLRGGGWVAFNGCCPPSSLHRSIRIAAEGDRLVKTETFAIDWIRIEDGVPFEGDGARPEQWFGFGSDVLAVADGTVVFVRDGMPEEAPNQPVQHVQHPGDYGGNQVIIEIAPGVWAFYGHLQPGSITVAAGDAVAAGQPIARLGNTGNTTAPHLHFGLLDAPDPLTGDSLPMVFDRYVLTGTLAAGSGAATPVGETGDSTPVAEAGVAGVPEAQVETLPLNMSVVEFP